MFGLIRVAIIVLLAVLVYRLVKRWLAQLEKPSASRPGKIGNMVRCHYCNLHLPEQEALHRDNAWYCNQDHYRKDKADD